jgi:hypothetical protein
MGDGPDGFHSLPGYRDEASGMMCAGNDSFDLALSRIQPPV